MDGVLVSVQGHVTICPPQINKILACGCKKNCSTQACSCRKSGVRCTESCKCSNDCCENQVDDEHDIEDEPSDVEDLEEYE